MTIKMKYWAPRLSGQNNKYEVKLNHLKLELGLFGAQMASANDRIAIQITAGKRSSSSKPTKTALSLPLHRSAKPGSTYTSLRRFIRQARTLTWDARDLSDFHVLLKDGSLASCDMAFLVLFGEGGGAESDPKMVVIGKASTSVSVAELLVTEEKKKTTGSNSQIQRKLPIKLRVNGLSIETTLSVSVSLRKVMKNSHDTQGALENQAESEKERGVIEKVKYLTSLKNKKKKVNGRIDQVEQVISRYDSEGSPVFDSDDSSNELTTSSGSGSSVINTAGSSPTNGSERFMSSKTETRLDTVQRSWSMLSLNRSLKRWNFGTTRTKQETLTTHPGPFTKSGQLCPQVETKDNASNWEMKELRSRDGQAKLKTNVFFASFDQRSQQASGESACTALVALIAHWLHSNQNMPTRPQFNSLITEGSSEWRRLCHSDAYLKLFPDKHFDLETVIEANLRPLTVLPEKSYTGFFSPEKFECLKGAMSFDDIWDHINSKVFDNEPRVYIVSWNDHFFVLKVEADAYYIIDTLGERLFEGCQQAFVLKFDHSSLMYGKADKAEKLAPLKGSGGTKSSKCREENDEIICGGKDCCKEFIKRFLAAISVRQLEEEKKKGTVYNPYLHRQLQIDFHYSSSSSSSSSPSASSSTLSPFSSGVLEAELYV